MMIILLAFTCIISWMAATYIIPVIQKLSSKKRLFDMPDIRKMHKTPVSRLGGASFMPIVIGTTATISILSSLQGDIYQSYLCTEDTLQTTALLGGTLLLYFVGLFDDLIGVRYSKKFIFQFVSGLMLCATGIKIVFTNGLFPFISDPLPAWISIPLTLFTAIYITNSINLIDGLDGLASGIACIAMLVLLCIFAILGKWFFCILICSAISTIIGFFYFNVFSKKHKIFMGDTGSLSIGFFLSFFIFYLLDVQNVESCKYGIVAISTLAIPMLDVIRVALCRMKRGANPFLPDKTHIHHKLLETGMSPHKVTASILLLTISFTIINYILMIFEFHTFYAVILDSALYLLIMIIIRSKINKNKSSD